MKPSVCKVLAVFLLSCLPCYAQQKQFESLMSTFQAQWRARDYPNAAETLENALVLAQKSGNVVDVVRVKEWLSSAYVILGDTQKAVRFAEESLTIIRQNRPHFADRFGNPETEILSLLGLAHARLGNYPVALKYLREELAIQLAEERSRGFAGMGPAKALQRLGVALYLSGDVSGAEKTFRESYQSFQVFKNRLTHDGSTREYEIEILRWLERVLVDQNRTDEALEMAQRSRAGSLGVVLASRLGESRERQTAVPNPEQIRRIARDEQSTLVEYSIVYEADPVIPLEFSDYEMLPAAAVYIWVVQPAGQITFRKVGFGKQGISLARLISRARDSIGARGRDSVAQEGGSASQSKQVLQELYKLLVAPIEDLLPTDPDARVVLIPQDLLYLVPFAALQDEGGRYLIEKHTLTAGISLETLQLSRERFQQLPAHATAALVVGNPAMPRGLPPLAGAEQEAVTVAGLFGAEALTGGRATKSAVIERIGNSRLVHLATHGLLNGESEQLSSLALAPSQDDLGFLTAREIRSLKLNAELAVLSACNTGRGRLTGDGVVGLARSFAEAGVPSIVVSLWSVPDSPTAALMVEFYKGVRNGADKARALRTAMLTTMKQYPEPSSWAAFTLLGVPDASSSLRTVHGTGSAAAPGMFFRVFPIPEGAQGYRESASSTIEGEVDVLFSTNLSLQEVVDFYRKTFAAQGLSEHRALTQIDARSVSLAFDGPWKDRSIVVQFSEFGLRSVSVRFEKRHR